MAERKGGDFRLELRSAERFNERATAAPLLSLKTPFWRSMASLVFMTRADHFLEAGRFFAVRPAPDFLRPMTVFLRVAIVVGPFVAMPFASNHTLPRGSRLIYGTGRYLASAASHTVAAPKRRRNTYPASIARALKTPNSSGAR